jgi:chorismate mutase
MSEYQRYEFMTVDRPLTREQLDAVDSLSSHIEASSTHAIIEYHWGDFKHDPIKVLREFFDGFLYWANWGSPELAFRFPHGILPADLIDGYDFDEFVTFTRYPDYDILDIHFAEMEPPDEWIEYELGPLIPIRDELMEGDLRSLYIAWLAAQSMIEGYEEEEDDEDEEDYEIGIAPVPSAFDRLTEAQQALAELLRVPEELLVAAARHSQAAAPSKEDDVAAWLKLLPPERRDDYMLRLARNEPGLGRQLLYELRELGQDKTTPSSTGERIDFATLVAESKAIKGQLERERREQEQRARQRHLQEVHDRQEDYWRQAEQAVTRGVASGYDEALRLLVELRDAADEFKESQEFQDRFSAWVRPHLRRPAFVKRLQGRKFSLPEA